jgi:hypothetical protein
MTAAVDLAQYGTTSPSWRNRIINGGMTIDQRNAGASIALPDGNANYLFAVDRFGASRASGGTATAQQSTVAPSGYINSFLYTTGAAITPAAGDTAQLFQAIEGFNIADLGWGTANAQTVTLSFWVRSSLTGTFSGVFRNSAGDRSYVFSFTIASANTFEYKTITILGDTSGTWLTNNQRGIFVSFDMGCGSDFRTATVGSWVSGSFRGATGSIQLNTTSSATFYITGVQLERGTVATPFDYRGIGQELSLCQRYFQKSGQSSSGQWIPGSTTNAGLDIRTAARFVTTTNRAAVNIPFFVPMRVNPSITIYPGRAGVTNTASRITVYNDNTLVTFNAGGLVISVNGVNGHFSDLSTSTEFYTFNFVAEAEL